jgi:hypothetical protein
MIRKRLVLLVCALMLVSAQWSGTDKLDLNDLLRLNWNIRQPNCVLQISGNHC